MTVRPQHLEEVGRLASLLLGGDIGADDRRQLEKILLDDPLALDYYQDYIDLHSLLYWQYEAADEALEEISLREPTSAGKKSLDGSCKTALASAPIILNLAHDNGPHSSSYFSPGSMLFSYGVSAVVVVAGLLIAWTVRVAQLQEVALAPVAAPVVAAVGDPEMEFVGRITGMVGCHWADPSTEAVEGASVPIGRRFALASGLMEITYNSSAKVILQGPCQFTVERNDGGFLTLGKLTAKVESQDSTRKTKQGDLRPQLPNATPSLFVIRTPSAIVTDLGTEFAVEVDQAGVSKAFVFRGKIEVRLASAPSEGKQSVPLTENESARIEPGPRREIIVRRDPGRTEAFARRMPKRVPLPVFSTGAACKEGHPDPHWELVAVSNDPQFKPRAATVAKLPRGWWMPNDITQSQWISANTDFDNLANQATFTFRTSFDLKNVLPETAILRGRFMVDNHIKAIRLNGQSINLPDHGYGGPFFNWYDFKMTQGFKEGSNQLEVDVFNGGDTNPNATSPMGCRIELEGHVNQHWTTNETASSKP